MFDAEILEHAAPLGWRQRLACMIGRHTPRVDHVYWGIAGYAGECLCCGDLVRLVRSNAWRLDRRVPRN